MKIKGFFLDRYLIAVYRGDWLVCVADNIPELCELMNITPKQAHYGICVGKFTLVDITQIHDDCFMREDLEFLCEVLQIKEVSNDKGHRTNCLRSSSGEQKSKER